MLFSQDLPICDGRGMISFRVKVRTVVILIPEFSQVRDFTLVWLLSQSKESRNWIRSRVNYFKINFILKDSIWLYLGKTFTQIYKHMIICIHCARCNVKKWRNVSKIIRGEFLYDDILTQYRSHCVLAPSHFNCLFRELDLMLYIFKNK